MRKKLMVLVGAMTVAPMLFSVTPSAAANTVFCGPHRVTILGTSGDDVLQGTDGPDVIHGLAGDDQIEGMGGDDVICGGSGGDTLFDGEGRDELFGELGNDVLYATFDGEIDLIDGGYGADVDSRTHDEHDLCDFQFGLIGPGPPFKHLSDGEISQGCEDGAVTPVVLPPDFLD